MDNIYDLYRNDLPALEDITRAFFTRLFQLAEEAPALAEQGNWEILHRSAHQLKSTATLYELNGLTNTLSAIAGGTRVPPGAEMAQQLKHLCSLLPTHTEEARQQVAQKLPYVFK